MLCTHTVANICIFSLHMINKKRILITLSFVLYTTIRKKATCTRVLLRRSAAGCRIKANYG